VLFSAIEEAVILQNNHYATTSTRLERIITQITALQEAKIEMIGENNDPNEPSEALSDYTITEEHMISTKSSATS